jgi:hypothetical protein
MEKRIERLKEDIETLQRKTKSLEASSSTLKAFEYNSQMNTLKANLKKKEDELKSLTKDDARRTSGTTAAVTLSPGVSMGFNTGGDFSTSPRQSTTPVPSSPDPVVVKTPTSAGVSLPKVLCLKGQSHTFCL